MSNTIYSCLNRKKEIKAATFNICDKIVYFLLWPNIDEDLNVQNSNAGRQNSFYCKVSRSRIISETIHVKEDVTQE